MGLRDRLKTLKQEKPGILSIVVTGASDSELMIELINQAQIFRFLSKPLNQQLIRSHLLAALERCRLYTGDAADDLTWFATAFRRMS